MDKIELASWIADSAEFLNASASVFFSLNFEIQEDLPIEIAVRCRKFSSPNVNLQSIQSPEASIICVDKSVPRKQIDLNFSCCFSNAPVKDIRLKSRTVFQASVWRVIFCNCSKRMLALSVVINISTASKKGLISFSLKLNILQIFDTAFLQLSISLDKFPRSKASTIHMNRRSDEFKTERIAFMSICRGDFIKNSSRSRLSVQSNNFATAFK